jgi:hypothetical protein
VRTRLDAVVVPHAPAKQAIEADTTAFCIGLNDSTSWVDRRDESFRHR